MKFRKKPVEIEAWQFTPDRPTFVPSWIKLAWFHRMGTRDIMLLPTLGGDIKAFPGDWIIKGVQGEVYPCKPDIFDMTYERWKNNVR